MKERPILFSAPMVIAIQKGRKTQTRRIMNPQPKLIGGEPLNFNIQASRLGKPGDLLYVKEAAWMWCEKKPNGITKTGKPKWLYAPLREAPVFYCADHPNKPKIEIAHNETGNEWGWRKKIGRFLPRWALRTTLEIVSVRVERLHDISEEDAIAEGLRAITKDGKTVKYGIPDSDGYPGNDNHGWNWCDWNVSPVAAYKRLWESINDSGSWNLNPFVWVVEFKTLEIARAAA